MGLVRTLACCLMAASMTAAFDVRATQPYEEYSKHIEGAQNQTALNDGFMGDSVSLYNGATEFTATDIDIPGNNSLPVQLRRRFSVELQTGLGSSKYGGISNWDIDVPYIDTGWALATWPNTRCSQALQPNVPAPLTPGDVWHGISVHIPGASSGKLLSLPDPSLNIPIPRPTTSGLSYHWTTAQRDMVSCIPMQSGLAGEGFLLQTTDGLKYYFNVATTRFLEPIKYESSTIGRTQYYLLASKIEDRFGNTVVYAYNANGYPTSITSSDSRQIKLYYNGSNDRLDHATVNEGTLAERTWFYTYGTSGDNANMLRFVTLPDNSQWQYSQVGTLVPDVSTWDASMGSNCGPKPPIPFGAGITYTITHPGGAQGAFVLSVYRHPRSGVNINSCIGHPVAGGVTNYKLTIPNFFDSITLTQKTITGPGLAPLTWTYDYPSGSVALWGTRAVNSPYPCTDTTACPPEKTVTVHEPDGTKTDYTYGYLYASNEGRLLKTTTYDQNDAVKRVETTMYLPESAASGQNFYTIYGYGFGDDEPSTLNVRPVISRTIEQDGATYSWSVPTGCSTGTKYCFDTFGNPTKVIKASSPGDTRTEQMTYILDNDQLITKYWLLGLSTQTKCIAPTTAAPLGCGAAGTVMSETTYHGQYGLPLTTKSFGKLQQTLTYNFTTGTQDGTLNTVKDGNNHVTTLTNWYRGIPKAIAYADSHGMSASVDDNGWITSVVNETGDATGYGYDAMGRVSAITYPTGDSTAYNDTNITYTQVATAEYGIPGSHWKRTESTGNSRNVTYYDGMLRPIVVDRYDTADIANTRSVAVKRYNVSGLQSFQSYPLASLTDWADAALTGIKSTYDALDRIRTSTQDSELGQLTTTTAYVAGVSGPYTQVTNPRGNVSRMSYQTFDAPSNDAPVLITQANGALVTTIVRDPFGKPITITRSNAGGSTSETRSYTYNANQELCKVEEPETGTTLMGYDLAGNLSWSAAGLTGSPACNANGDTAAILARKVSRSYDLRNRLQHLTFADGRGDQDWTYTDDGLPDTITTYNDAAHTLTVLNDYDYNHRRLLVGESSVRNGGSPLAIGYGYDSNGHLSSQVWPDGKTAQFQPNALGQISKVDTGGNPHAWNAKYYPNGALKSFTYGNGIKHEMHQNDRQLPDWSKDSYSSTNFLYDNYEYDQNGNVAAILDGATGTGGRGDRTMEYDDADRLISATSPMFGNGASGTAQFAYDALDNLTRVIMPATATRQGRNWFYCYDASWHLTNVKKIGCDGQSVIGIGYDAQGNVNNKNGTLFDFDFGNRLRTAGPTTNPLETYQYDGYGRRVLSVATSGNIQSVYSQAGQLVYQENARTGKRINYYYLAGSLVNEVETTITTGVAANRFQHTDALGSPILVTDGGRSPQGVRNEYEPYGMVLAGGIDDRPGYTSHVADAQTGMDYMQQRYYDPMIGRFLSVDPVTATSVGGNFNRYWYSNDNPYRFTDPDGRLGRCQGGSISCHGGVTTVFDRRSLSSSSSAAQTKSSGNAASTSQSSKGPYGRDVRPTDPEWTRDPTLRKQMDKAWEDATPNGRPSERHENGGWVIQHFGAEHPELARTAPGSQDQMGEDSLNKPDEFECACRVLAFFHTHQNPSSEGYYIHTNQYDYQFYLDMGVPGMIRNEEGYEYSPIPER